MFRSLMAFVVACSFISCFVSSACAQATPPSPQFAVAAPKVLLLVYQQFLPGKSGTRQNLETDVARTFDRLAAPVSWIETESLTGPSQALFLDPANSFAEIEYAGGALAQLYAAHADLAQSQGQIDDVIASSRTLTAVLRADLSLSPGSLNLGKARYLRIRSVQVRPERERDFVNAFTANRPQNPSVALAVYQVNAGLPDITFIFVEPLHSMQDVDQRFASSADLAAFSVAASSETNLFAIHPEMSHVGKDFPAADSRFWMQAAPAQ